MENSGRPLLAADSYIGQVFLDLRFPEGSIHGSGVEQVDGVLTVFVAPALLDFRGRQELLDGPFCPSLGEQAALVDFPRLDNCHCGCHFRFPPCIVALTLERRAMQPFQSFPFLVPV